jgi:tRNA modification GTPase
MLHDPQDTIVALSSAPGPGLRAIVRLSGAAAFRIAGTVFTSADPLDLSRRRCYTGHLSLDGLAAPLPADLYVWPGPRTYTGQDLLELHTLSCPPVLDLLVGQLLNAGARAAQPGEFTLRAFLAGKLDLTQAEAVLGIIAAGSRDELRLALGQLAGGVARPLQELRDDLLDLLAEVEAGLDFAEEDIHFVSRDELLKRLARGMAQVTILQRQLTQRAVDRRAFRVVLAGEPNAGKSSLFNALAGAAAALVSPEPGTTRDYLVRNLKIDQVLIELVDTAGWQETNSVIGEQAQSLGREQAEQADLVVWCVEAGKPATAAERALLARKGKAAVVGVATKCDLAPGAPSLVATSAVTGLGLDELRTLLGERGRSHFRPGLAPSLSRCRHHVDALLEHLRQAHAAVLYEDPPEVLALELRGALDELGEMVGAVYTDDLLDRIFSRFCIGK